MSKRRDLAPVDERDVDPLVDDDELLARTFHGVPRPRKGRGEAKEAAPTHYKVVSISLYLEDIARIDALVAELRARGNTRANRSLLIRHAVGQVDLSRIGRDD